MSQTPAETAPDLMGEIETNKSETHRVRVGCGNLYVTIVIREKGRFDRLIMPRQSKFHCPETTREAIAKLVTFGGRRNMRQIAKDLGGDKYSHHCGRYHAGCEASSCFDAVSQTLKRWQKERRKRNKDDKKA